MSHPVPDSYLRAVALTWPLGSAPAHRLRLTRLTRRAPGVLAAPTQELAAELASWLQPRCRGLSLDALSAVTEGAFFPDGCDSISLSSLLVHAATSCLGRDGGRVTIPADARYPQRLEEMRWLTLLMPADLLIAALYAAEGLGDPPTDRLSLADPPLRRLLAARPAAETHLHIGAAFSFGTLWTSVVGRMAAEPALAMKLPKDPTCPWQSPHALASMLVAAAIARVLLGAFLWSRERCGDQGAFDCWLTPYLERISPRVEPTHPRRVPSLIHTALTTLVRGPHPEVSPARLSFLFRRLAGPRPLDPDSLSALAELDPLASWLGVSTEPWPEHRFMTRAIRYVTARNDPAFTEVFWQYQRVRIQLYQFLVQQPGTAGLDWFQRHYERLAPFRTPLRRLRFESALHLDSKDIYLGSLEARTSPPAGSSDVIEDVRALRRAAVVRKERGENTEVALVFHFLKQRENGSGAVRRLQADPRQLVHGCRFGAWVYRSLREAMAVERALEHHPELLFVVRGVDVASSELAIPTWATLPALSRVRRASERAAERLWRRQPGCPAEALRVTYHAGEEYVRLAEGLRRVHELIEHGVVAAGDRLGHAICLGEDVSRWCQRHRRVVQAREDRLDDLIWELDRGSSGDIPVDASRASGVRDEAARHGRAIFGRSVDLEELSAARQLRHDVGCLQRLGFPFVRAYYKATTDPARRVFEHLTDTGQYLRGREPVPVEVTADEALMLNETQMWLRAKVASLGITVESNPSSNILIGDFPSMSEHPSLTLCPVDTVTCAKRLLLSINADDPMTFATCLSDEMSFVYGSLLRSGTNTAAALAWIAERRDEGFRSRFTVPLEYVGGTT